MTEEMKGLTRADLYELVWSEPVTRLARKCGISDVGLAKTCRRSNIPVPPRGYWAKKAAGKGAPRKPPLPPLPKRHRPEAIILTMRLADPVNAEAPPEPERPKVVVAPDLEIDGLHPLVGLAYAQLRKAKVSKDGFVDAKDLGIHVRAENVPRAIRIADALVKELETRGYAFGTGGDGKGCVSSEPDQVAVALAESAETGRLSLCWDGPLTGRKTWSDGARLSVDKQLGHFVVAVEEAIGRLRAERLEKERVAAEKARLAKREADRRTAAEIERAMAKTVRAAMAAWEEAGRLRVFAAALEEAAATGRVSASQAAEWAAFAKGLAERVDPLIPDKPVELKTCDYLAFEDWFAELRSLVGKEKLEHKEYSAERVYKERRTPDEAATEIDWTRWHWW